MAKTKEIFICDNCKAQVMKWQGQCPSCKEWNTLKPVQVRTGKKVTRPLNTSVAAPVSLAGVDLGQTPAVSTGDAGLDRVLGQGITPGAAILLGGEPGIGKSTLLLQLADTFCRQDKSVVYLSGEESLNQLKMRAERLNTLNPTLKAMATTSAEQAFSILESAEPPELLIADSIQTLNTSMVEGTSGSVAQVRAVGTMLIELAKKADCALILVGHVTKDGQIAGPKLLEHMVDTVLSLEGDRGHWFRILRVLKNRFGPADELAVFTMGQDGMRMVEDPSTFFLDTRDESLPGTALAMAMDGKRPFAVEIQALAGRSFLAIPRRVSLGFDTNRLNLILAVMEKRLGLNFGQSDIYVKVSGGLKLSDPGLDLAVVASIMSSFHDRALPAGSVFWGEVDLNGRARPVSGMDIRLKQAKRLGYGPLFHPAGKKSACETIMDLANILFG